MRRMHSRFHQKDYNRTSLELASYIVSLESEILLRHKTLLAVLEMSSLLVSECKCK